MNIGKNDRRVSHEKITGSRYMEVFTQLEGVTGFFSLKDGASDGYPYNRTDIFAELGLDQAVPVWPRQIHGDTVAVIDSVPAGPLSIPDTDGLITNQKNVLLTTVHADCLPVYFFDVEKGVIGLAHAGWRGTVASIATGTVERMIENFGCERSDIYVYIGPGISRCCFETGREVYEQFAGKWNFIGEITDEKVNGEGETKYYIDLKEMNRRQLVAVGISPEKIEVSSHWTCCEPELFCSYRREGGTYRRMGAGLCML